MLASLTNLPSRACLCAALSFLFFLQTIFSALQAAQQALSAAASRAALRQRQQEQLAALLGSEQPLAGLASGRRVALGSHHEQVRGM